MEDVDDEGDVDQPIPVGAVEIDNRQRNGTCDGELTVHDVGCANSTVAATAE